MKQTDRQTEQKRIDELNAFFADSANVDHFSNMLLRVQKNFDSSPKTEAIAAYITEQDAEHRADVISAAIVKAYDMAKSERYTETPLKLYLYKAMALTAYNEYYKRVKRAAVAVAMAEPVERPDSVIYRVQMENCITCEQDRQIINLKFNGYTVREIAERLHIDKSKVSRRLQAIKAYYMAD